MRNDTIELKQKQNQTYYFANKEVVIIKIYESVHLAKIKFGNADVCTIVDINALSYTPDFTSAISLRILEDKKLWS